MRASFFRLALVVVVITSAAASARADVDEDDAQRVEAARRLKTAGAATLGLGIVALVPAPFTAIAGLSEALGTVSCGLDNSFGGTQRQCSNNGPPLFHATMGLLAVGVPLLVTGSILYSVGKKRLLELKREGIRVDALGPAPLMEGARAQGATLQVVGRF